MDSSFSHKGVLADERLCSSLGGIPRRAQQGTTSWLPRSTGCRVSGWALMRFLSRDRTGRAPQLPAGSCGRPGPAEPPRGRQRAAAPHGRAAARPPRPSGPLRAPQRRAPPPCPRRPPAAVSRHGRRLPLRGAAFP